MGFALNNALLMLLQPSAAIEGRVNADNPLTDR